MLSLKEQKTLCTQGGEKGEGVSFKEFDYKNALKHEKGDNKDFLTTPSTPTPLDFQLLCIYGMGPIVESRKLASPLQPLASLYREECPWL
jgi:hypothetical protein